MEGEMTDHGVPSLPAVMYEEVVRGALAEDLGRGGDLTTDAVVPAASLSRGRVISRAAGVVAGLAPGASVFQLLDPDLEVTFEVSDGDHVVAGSVLMTVSGRTRPILTGERTALNLVGRLSGVATLTRAFVDAVAGSGARVSCTRKTTPGLRTLEKYAVRCGGGTNHRFGLDGAVLVKDNHVAVAGSVRAAVERARAAVGHTVIVEVEVDTLEQLGEALEVGADAVLLDNMNIDELRRAVEMVGGRLVTEASGGITLDTAAAAAATGVDLLSIGALTHSAPSLDLTLELDPTAG
jgi:nicotinate-nucleotide pyrophosphorylase (carboxylating)